VVAARGYHVGVLQQRRHAFEGEVGVEGSTPPHQRVRPTQHRIHRRVDNVQRAVVVGNGGDAVGDVQLCDGEAGELPVRNRRRLRGEGEQGTVAAAEQPGDPAVGGATAASTSQPGQGRSALATASRPPVRVCGCGVAASRLRMVAGAPGQAPVKAVMVAQSAGSAA